MPGTKDAAHWREWRARKKAENAPPGAPPYAEPVRGVFKRLDGQHVNTRPADAIMDICVLCGALGLVAPGLYMRGDTYYAGRRCIDHDGCAVRQVEKS